MASTKLASSLELGAVSAPFYLWKVKTDHDEFHLQVATTMQEVFVYEKGRREREGRREGERERRERVITNGIRRWGGGGGVITNEQSDVVEHQ